MEQVADAAHHLTVGQHVRPADLEDAPRTTGLSECGQQVRQHVINSDGLAARRDPARMHHHGQSLHERSQDLE